jgi:competence protein ComEC
MWVFDVGEGDAILLLTPRGHTVLVDGGPGVTPLAEGIGSHLPFWQHSIDVVVVTQPQQENMMGLVDLLGRYEVGQVAQSEFTGTGSLQEAWHSKLRETGTPEHHVTRGDEIGFEDEPDVILKVLNPGKDDILKGDKSTLENNRSVVLAVEYGKVRMLLASDVEEAGEANMLRLAGDSLESQVLKVPSHGSGDATSPRFVEAVQPKVSIISVGEGNKAGYPSIDVINRLQDAGSQVYRTDQDGTVEVIAEKDRLWVKSER